MSLTQNEKICQVTNETMVVGVDIASETHYARVFDNRGIEFGKVFSFGSNREGFEQFSAKITKLMRENGKTTVIVGAEPTGHYWFTFGEYLKNQGVRLVFVNPMHVKRTKEIDDNRAGKNDRKDPKTIAQLVIGGRYLEPYIPEDIYAELRVANNNRVRITAEMVAIENQVRRWFSIYFPEYKLVFGDWSCASSIIVLRNAPLPQDVLKLEAAGINALWREQKLRAVGIGRATRLYEVARTSVGVTEGVKAARCELEMLLDDYLSKQKQLEIVMMILETLVIQLPHAEKLLAIKGIGLLTVAGFFAEVGDLGRFKSPKQIQKLAGYEIAENSSGKHKGQTRISKRGRRLLRYTLFQAVTSLILHQSGFAALHKHYKTRAVNPLKGKQSKVALCCKLIRIFWLITTKGKDFDSYTMMNDIERNQPTAA